MIQLNVTTRSSRVFLGAVLRFVVLQLPVHQCHHVIDSIVLRRKKSTTAQVSILTNSDNKEEPLQETLNCLLFNFLAGTLTQVQVLIDGSFSLV